MTATTHPLVAAPADRATVALVVVSFLTLALVVPAPWLAVPLAAGTLVASLVHARRAPASICSLRVSASVSLVTLLTALVLAASLLSSVTSDVPGESVQVALGTLAQA